MKHDYALTRKPNSVELNMGIEHIKSLASIKQVVAVLGGNGIRRPDIY